MLAWKSLVSIALAGCLILLTTPGTVPAAAPAASSPAPVRPPNITAAAWAATAGAQSAEVIVTAPGFADLSAAAGLPGQDARAGYVAGTLMQFAEQAQRALRRDLAARGVPYTVLWIANSLYLPSASRATLEWLAARADVARVDLDVKSPGIEPPALSALSSLLSPLHSVEWGVARVHAPEAWAQGYTGQGIVIADLDTGAQWDHPALLPQYRGWNGITATHDYNWYDPTSKSVAVPSDDQSHGTHTLGTLIGVDGTGYHIGVAPGATWIACRNMNTGFGSVALYTACFQFALAPTDVNGANPDPSRAADITSNSWSCWSGAPWYEAGCEMPSALLTVTQVLRQAGIMVVAAAGNEGNGCSTVTRSPGTYDEAITVGATDNTDAIAGFSNRGPSSYTGRVKPNLVAPGVNVGSAALGGGYTLKSGTSMATPHVAGVVALLWSAAPWLRGQIEETEAILHRTARPLTTSQTCGGVPGTAVPNNTFGYGMVDAAAAIGDALTRAEATGLPPQPASAPLTFTIAVTNAFQAYTATLAVVTATLPASTRFESASPPAVRAGDTISWALGDLPPSSTVRLSFTVRADAPGVILFKDYSLAFDGHQATAPAPAVTILAYATRRWFPPFLHR